MSYCSENRLPLSTPVSRIIEVIELLDYVKCKSDFKTSTLIGCYIWKGPNDGISYVGIALNIFKYEDCISVQTRTRLGRSYWDLQWQNKTISLLKSLFGGKLITDEGQNRYLAYGEPKPSKISCALYVNRWVFHNAMLVPRYSFTCKKDDDKRKLTGFQWIDQMNPEVLSNNMLIPYLIGIWEAYFRSSYISILKHADIVPEKALKNCRISNKDFLSVIRDGVPLELLLADSLSFQRPSIIAENFRQLNPNIDITRWLKTPYHGRKTSLFDSISHIIDARDILVHTGKLDTTITESYIRQIMDDMEEAANRTYNGLGDVFNFIPKYDF